MGMRVWHGPGTREGEGSGRVREPGREQGPVRDRCLGAGVWEWEETARQGPGMEQEPRGRKNPGGGSSLGL